MSKEYEFDLYVTSKGKSRGHRVHFIARLTRKVAEAVLDGIVASVDAQGGDVGGGFSEVRPGATVHEVKRTAKHKAVRHE